MAFCSHCGYEVLDGEEYCEVCGNRIRINGEKNLGNKMTTNSDLVKLALIREIWITIPWLELIIGAFLFISGMWLLSITLAISAIILAYIQEAIIRSQVKKNSVTGYYFKKSKFHQGFDSWNPIRKSGWVILNIYTLGIPQILCAKATKKAKGHQ